MSVSDTCNTSTRHPHACANLRVEACGDLAVRACSHRAASYLSYIWNISIVKSAASSPPVPARTSTIAFASSASSLARRARRRGERAPTQVFGFEHDGHRTYRGSTCFSSWSCKARIDSATVAFSSCASEASSLSWAELLKARRRESIEVPTTRTEQSGRHRTVSRGRRASHRDFSTRARLREADR